MSIAEEINKLRSLHFDGILSDEEFETAKDAIIHGAAKEANSDRQEDRQFEAQPTNSTANEDDLARSRQLQSIAKRIIYIDREYRELQNSPRAIYGFFSLQNIVSLNALLFIFVGIFSVAFFALTWDRWAWLVILCGLSIYCTLRYGRYKHFVRLRRLMAERIHLVEEHRLLEAEEGIRPY